MADLIVEIPCEGEHPDPHPIKLPQLLGLSLTDASLLHGEQAGHFACGLIAGNIPEAVHRSQNVPVALKLFPIVSVHGTDLLPGITALVQRNEHGEILQQITAFAQPQQIDMAGILPQGSGPPLFS